MDAPALSPGPALHQESMSAVGSSGSSAPLWGPESADYRHRLRTTPLGWARLDRWCLWVEPPATTGASALWDQRWFEAVQKALAGWTPWLPITIVADPQRAQILVERRRPPLQQLEGRWRASHGRSLLRLRRVERDQRWRLEPEVRVLIGPGQAPAALQATALHELGHAFGLWGHSDQGADVMAAVPGPIPRLALSERDRRTLIWLYQQPTRFGPEAMPPQSGSRQ